MNEYFHVVENGRRDGKSVYVLVRTYRSWARLMNYLLREGGVPAWVLRTAEEAYIPAVLGGTEEQYWNSSGWHEGLMPLLPLVDERKGKVGSRLETSAHRQSLTGGDERAEAIIERYVGWIKAEAGQSATVEFTPGLWGGWNGRVVVVFDGGASEYPDLVWVAVSSPSLRSAVDDLAGRLAVLERSGWTVEPLERWQDERREAQWEK